MEQRQTHKPLVPALAALASLFAVPIGAQQVAPFPLVPGEAVATCFSDSNDDGFLLGVFDLRNPPAQLQGDAWMPPVYHGERGPGWNVASFCDVSDFCDEDENRMVEVFGIALDDAPNPNIYLTATSSYTDDSDLGRNQGNTSGPGEVFKIDGTSGTVSLFATLPNTGEGLGNVAYDAVNGQFFVSNFHDGKIYRLSSQGGAPLDAFDPFSPHVSGTPGFVPRDERPWGVGVHAGRLYFGMWEDEPVWSVTIDSGTGVLTGSPRVEIDETQAGRWPVADIAFSGEGRMLIAERGMASDTRPTPHNSRVLEFVQNPSTGEWEASPAVFEIGEPGLGSNRTVGENAAGGVDYLCLPEGDRFALATGDALRFFSGPPIYGIQMTPATGGTKDNSFLIDLDFVPGSQDKLDIGDVEAISRCEGPCLEVVDEKVLCEEDGSFSIELRFRNLRPELIEHVFALEAPEGITVSPSYFNLAGQAVEPDTVSPPLSVRVEGASPGETLTFLLTIHDAAIQECCSFEFTVELPSCDCAQVVTESLACKRFTLPWQTASVDFNFELENLSGQEVEHLLFVPSRPNGVRIQPNHVSTSLGDFDSTGPVHLSFSGPGSSSSEVCFLASLHDADFTQCCAIEHCVEPQFCFFVNEPPLEPVDSDFTYYGRELHVEPRGPAVRYGFELPFPGGFGCSVGWGDLDVRDEIPVGATLSVATRDAAGEVIAHSRIRSAAAGDYALTASFPGFGDGGVRAEIYRLGELVATVAGDEGVLLRYPRWPTSAGAALRDGVAYTIWGHEDLVVALPDGTTVVGDTTALSPRSPDATVEALGEVRVLASADVPRIVVTDLAVAFDCNDNGVPDATDVASGTSADVNGNDRPDECERDVFDLVAVLNTGFDEASGELLPLGDLPEGTEDDDWRIVGGAPSGPAKVVIEPDPNWPPTLGDSRWISTNPRGLSTGAESVRYRHCFCLSEQATRAEVNLFLFADDLATVFLNGTALNEAGGSFQDPAPLAISHTEQVGSRLLVPGQNCIAVQVNDPGRVVTGFALVGEVRAPNGVCR